MLSHLQLFKKESVRDYRHSQETSLSAVNRMKKALSVTAPSQSVSCSMEKRFDFTVTFRGTVLPLFFNTLILVFDLFLFRQMVETCTLIW